MTKFMLAQFARFYQIEREVKYVWDANDRQPALFSARTRRAMQ